MAARTRKATVKRYETHDNGSRPFFVEVRNATRVTVFKNMDTFKKVGKKFVDIHLPPKLLFERTVKAVLPGKRSSVPGYYPKAAIGNSVLLQLSAGRYMFIGHEIFEFNTIGGESITDYVSNIGNSDVPYPYAVGKSSVYLMLNKIALPKEKLDMKNDPYDQFYYAQRLHMCIAGNPRTEICADRKAAKAELADRESWPIPLKTKTVKS